ncbi:MAG: hypothetical protein EOP61_30145, partial [Sphingomonadales bacterium]
MHGLFADGPGGLGVARRLWRAQDHAAPIAQSVSLALLGREFSDLPRKFNITISGCSHDCAHSRANDIGMTPAAKEINGYRVLGFHVALVPPKAPPSAT